MATPPEPARAVVPWSDTDASGRFHFTAPFRWAENAEHALLRDAGFGPEPFPRRAVTSSYLRPLMAGDPYTVDIGIEQIGSTSITYWWRVLSEDVVCVEGSHTAVHLDETGRPSPLPESLRTALRPHVRTK